MPIQIYRSSSSDSSGGTISSTIANPETLFDTIQAYDHVTPGVPNSVTPGFLFKKIFIKNESTTELTNAKIYFDFFPSTGPYSLGLALGTDTDTSAPQDETFVTGKDTSEALQISSIPVGAAVPVWIHFGWPENSGHIDPCQIGLCILGGTNARSWRFKFQVVLYEFPFPSEDENDYTSKAKDIFLVFFRNFFYKFYRPDLRWNPIPEYTKVFVADRLTYNLEEPEQRPSLIVVRGNMGFMESSKDQMLKMRFIDGDAYYTDLIRGQMMLQCIAREGLHAEFIGQTAFKAVKFFKQALRNMGLHEVGRVAIGEEIGLLVDTRPEAIMVPVNIQIAFQDKWFVTRHRLTVKGIDYTIDINKTGCRVQ